MNDYLWIILLIGNLFSKTPNNIERIDTMGKSNLREAFENTIRSKLENPETSAADIETLAKAYSELTKNDHMLEMARTVSSFGGFGGSPYPPALRDDTIPGNCASQKQEAKE